MTYDKTMKLSEELRDQTPEHTKRGAGDDFSDEPIHPDVSAAYDYVDSMIDVADIHTEDCLAWHG